MSYSPDRDTWRIDHTPPAPVRFGSSVVWTGDLLLVWGGEVDVPGTAAGVMSLRDGAAYDPDRDTWTTIPAAPIPGAAAAVIAWTGQEMVVWGGQGTEGGGASSVPRNAGAASTPTPSSGARSPPRRRRYVRSSPSTGDPSAAGPGPGPSWWCFRAREPVRVNC